MCATAAALQHSFQAPPPPSPGIPGCQVLECLALREDPEAVEVEDKTLPDTEAFEKIDHKIVMFKVRAFASTRGVCQSGGLEQAAVEPRHAAGAARAGAGGVPALAAWVGGGLVAISS